MCLSDLHNRLGDVRVPDGDVLVVAGDLTGRGTTAEVSRFALELGRLPHRAKVVVAGNHDWLFQREPGLARELLGGVAIYLEDAGAEVAGLRFWGSPWQPRFFDWAFNLERGGDLRARWDLIPADTDVLVTHGPPRGYGDLTPRGERVGCEDLLEAVVRVKPRLHVFGHIHAGYGSYRAGFPELRTDFVNASTCDEGYRPVNPPVVVDL